MHIETHVCFQDYNDPMLFERGKMGGFGEKIRKYYFLYCTRERKKDGWVWVILNLKVDATGDGRQIMKQNIKYTF